MIQATTLSSFYAYVQTEDNRISDPSINSKGITRYLFKFSNDMDGSVQYAYPEQWIYNRYSKFFFTYNITPDVFRGRVNLLPAGYWKYEVYEVTWLIIPASIPTVSSITAPVTEDFIFNPAVSTCGVVQGLVTKGKMFLDELAGTEEVSYIQNAKSVISLTIIDGGGVYAVAPTLTILGGGNFITQATATCTILAGVINTVTITNAGTGYTEEPQVFISNPGVLNPAQIIAEINQSNYIYTG